MGTANDRTRVDPHAQHLKPEVNTSGFLFCPYIRISDGNLPLMDGVLGSTELTLTVTFMDMPV